MSKSCGANRSKDGLAIAIMCMLALTATGCTETPVASQERLRTEALSASTTDKQLEATAELVEQGREAAEPLRQVFQESSDSQVQAAAAEGLGQVMDVDSFPHLLDALEDDSPEVRRAANEAIKNISGRDYFYNADDESERRAEAIARIRKFWKQAQQPGSMFIEYRRHPEKLAESKRKAAARYGGR